MIYIPIITSEGFKRFDNIPSSYYACGWVEGENVVKSITSEDEALIPPTYPNAPIILNGLATLESYGYEYFLECIKDEGVTIPEELLKD